MATLKNVEGYLENTKYTLPAELWEIIINKLTCSPRSMVAVSEVCKQWRHLVTRICHKYCAQNVDERLLTELLESAVTHKKCQIITENEENVVAGEEWIKAFWLNHETVLDLSPEKDRDVLHAFDSVISITTADPYLLVSTYNDNMEKTTVHVICSLDYAASNEFNEENHMAALLEMLNQSFNFEVSGKVFKTCVLNLPNPAILVITAVEMRAVMLPTNERELNTKRPHVMPTNPPIKGHPKTSCEGNYLLTQGLDDEDYLVLYEASFNPLGENKELSLDLKCRFKTESSAYSWIICRGLVTTMETSGHIRTYQINCLQTKVNREISSKLVENEQIYLLAESGLKKDMRYPNPTLFTKDFLFSSTLVSRDLLGYWHMDRDRDYWFIGNISSHVWSEDSQVITSPMPIRLQQVMLGQEVKQVVTAVYFERGVLLCGTKEGHLLGYKIHGKRNFTDENCFHDLTGMPWFSVSGVTTKSISRLGCLFTPFGLIVAVGEETGICPLVHIPLQSPL